MRVVVEVCSGPSKGRRILLRNGQSVHFGRSNQADFAFADNQMSSLHFSLSVNQSACRMKDLQTTNGTRFNGQFVAEAVLSDADEIVAGSTHFLVHIETAITETDIQRETTMVARSSEAVLDVKRELLFSSGKSTVLCESVLTPSGFHRLQSPVDESPSGWSTVRKRVFGPSGGIPMHWIVDLRMAANRPTNLPVPPIYLFDWLHPDVADLVTPRILTAGDVEQTPEVLNQLWGRNALVGMAAKNDGGKFVAHLQLAAKGFLVGDTAHAPKTVWGYCWPHALRTMLNSPPSTEVRQLLSEINCILIESDQAGWQLYTRPEMRNELEKLGIQWSNSNET